jgi:hypothetical protein
MPRQRFTQEKGSPVPILKEAGWTSDLVSIQRLEEKYFASAEDRTWGSKHNSYILSMGKRIPNVRLTIDSSNESPL